MAEQTTSANSEAKSALCTNCGKPIEGGVKFCPSCGTAAPVEPAKTEPQNKEENTANCKNCGKALGEGVMFCPSCGTNRQADKSEAKPVFCANCGKPIEGGVKFCPSCGAASGKSVKTYAQNQGLQQADPNDAEQNKGMAVVAYFLFFVPIITGDHKKSPFVMFHTNQGMVLFITYVAMWIASSILVSILYRVFATALYRSPLGSWGLLSLFGLITPLFTIVMLVLFIIGIMNALNGRMKPLPIIGRITLIK